MRSHDLRQLVDDKPVPSCQQTCCTLIVQTCYQQACCKLFQQVVYNKFANDKLQQADKIVNLQQVWRFRLYKL